MVLPCSSAVWTAQHSRLRNASASLVSQVTSAAAEDELLLQARPALSVHMKFYGLALQCSRAAQQTEGTASCNQSKP
jgi:hypothetical protein